MAGCFISPIKFWLAPRTFAKTCFYEPLMKAKNIYNKKKSQTDFAWIGYVGCKTRKMRLITKASSVVQSRTCSVCSFVSPLTKWKKETYDALRSHWKECLANNTRSGVLRVQRVHLRLQIFFLHLLQDLTLLICKLKGTRCSDCDLGDRASRERLRRLTCEPFLGMLHEGWNQTWAACSLTAAQDTGHTNKGQHNPRQNIESTS